MTTFRQLRKANRIRQAEWDPDGLLAELYYSNALAGEVGEVCNIIKKIERANLGLPGSIASVIDVANELADVIIYSDLLADHFNIDLGEAIATKFNATSDKYDLKTRFADGVPMPF